MNEITCKNMHKLDNHTARNYYKFNFTNTNNIIMHIKYNNNIIYK